MRGLGTGTFLLFSLGAFGYWAYTFEIDETVRATGRVVSEGRTQIVQVADGGVLRNLLVSEGDVVTAGQVLASLEKERAQAAVSEVNAEIANLEIAKLRARAEAKGIDPDFSEFTQSFPNSVAAQMSLYTINYSAQKNRLSAAQAALQLANDELQMMEELAVSGDVSRAEITRAKRDLRRLEGELTKIQDDYVAMALREVAEIEQRLATASFTLEERENVLSYTDIKAPQDGVVNQLKSNTLGAVLKPGEELMRISPTGGGEIIEAMIQPMDIGRLSINLPVTVRLDAFDSSIYGSLQGKLSYISAETVYNVAPNGMEMPMYVAHVSVDELQNNQRLSLSNLRPGLNATIDIRTGSRSIIVFLAKPLVNAFSGALSQK
jgi:adhesin transport system membrane fusion protein